MKVYKFGGASVRNADGVQNLLKIIGDERDLFIIVSAMGKTTNALEKVFEGLQKGDKAFSMEHITALRQYHAEIVNELYGAPTRLEKIERLFGELEQVATETVYRLIGLSVYSRADFIVTPDGTPYFLEINTLPGMTKTSLLPQEAAAVGIGYEELCEKIVEESLKQKRGL